MAKIMNPLYCLYSLFWDVGPLFWALLEVQVASLRVLPAAFGVPSCLSSQHACPTLHKPWPRASSAKSMSRLTGSRSNCLGSKSKELEDLIIFPTYPPITTGAIAVCSAC